MKRQLALAEILGHAEHNGIYRLPDAAVVAGAVAGAVTVAGSRFTGKSAMLDALAKARHL
jgi:hypothetical protein